MKIMNNFINNSSNSYETLQFRVLINKFKHFNIVIATYTCDGTFLAFTFANVSIISGKSINCSSKFRLNAWLAD